MNIIGDSFCLRVAVCGLISQYSLVRMLRNRPWIPNILFFLFKNISYFHYSYLTFTSPDPKGYGGSITLHQSSVGATESAIYFYSLIFFFDIVGPIGTKLSMNVHWMVPYKVYIFWLIRNAQKKQEAYICQKRLCPYNMDINYLFFNYFYEDFFNAFLKKNPFQKHG